MSRYHTLLKKVVEAPPLRDNYHLHHMQMMQQELGFPDRSFVTIHVGGTNGKGSVSTKIAAGLQLSGVRTGLYISPHVSTFRERISINGTMIAQEDVVFGLEKLFSLAQKLSLNLSFFELTTLLCFDYFAHEKVEAAVIEVGLGGRLDATNVIQPCLSVITSIRQDHTQLLGYRVEQIAREKAGIIKRGIPLILGPKAQQRIVKKQAFLNQSPCTLVSKRGCHFDEEDRWIAKAALQELKKQFPLKKEAIDEGITKRPKCRFEIASDTSSFAKNFPSFPKAIIFDVAHNPDGFRALKQAWRYFYSHQKPRVICGMSKDKDIARCMAILSQFASHVHLVEARHHRLASPKTIALFLQRAGFESISIEKKLSEGVQNAFYLASQRKEPLLICGSFFIMNEVRKALRIEEERDVDEIVPTGSEESPPA